MKYGDLALHELKIDPELHKLIPPMSPDEYRQLEENLKAEGCRHPLIAWNGTIIDGHNRYEICHKHGIPFAVEPIEFESKDEAVIWIIKNQFGRRNLELVDRVKLALTLKPLLARQAKERQKGGQGGVLLVPKLAQGKTRDELATIAGVGHSTINMYEKIQRDGTPEVKRRLDAKEITINKAYTETNKPAVPAIPQDLPPVPRREHTSKETKALISEAVANMTDTTRDMEFTIESVLIEIRGSAETFIRQFRRTVQTHKDKLQDSANKSSVLKVLDETITSIEEIRRSI